MSIFNVTMLSIMTLASGLDSDIDLFKKPRVGALLQQLMTPSRRDFLMANPFDPQLILVTHPLSGNHTFYFVLSVGISVQVTIPLDLRSGIWVLACT